MSTFNRTGPLLFCLCVQVCLSINTGCGSSEAPSGPDSCVWAQDGMCDEPVNCKLGTDSTDCEAACAEGKRLYLFGAACAYRSPPRSDPVDPTLGTGGHLHLTGHRDGTIKVPSGEDPKRIAERYYRLYVPASYDPVRPTPLVIVMAGHRVHHDSLADYTNLMPTADTNRFIVAYAEQEWRKDLRVAWWTDWNWGVAGVENPDLIFLRNLIDKLGAEYNLDRTRVMATGHSRGAAMAIIAAFELSDIISGACSESGFTEFGYQKRVQAWKGRRVPLVFVHGTLDTDICIDCTTGGACGVTPGRSCGGVEASDSLVAMLRAKGWTDNELAYHRLKLVAHRWQPQLNQLWYDFLATRPLPAKGKL